MNTENRKELKKMTIYNATELPTTKADRLYIMLDQKAPDFALVKGGITSDTLKNRFHCYRTSNPMLVLIATCEIRKNQDLKDVEQKFFDFFREVKGYDHVFGEWVAITNAKDIEAIKREGFRFFEKLFYRTKNNTYYNTEVYKLWNHRAR